MRPDETPLGRRDLAAGVHDEALGAHERHAVGQRAQLALNERLGDARVARLHALLDDCLERLDGDMAASRG